MKRVKRTERGWAGHFICADLCRFRRNTLLQYGGVKIVVSTVGAQTDIQREKICTIGHERYYETMVFHSENDKYDDIDVTRQIYVDSNWRINKIDAEIEANEMHETIVKEITKKLRRGYKFIQEKRNENQTDVRE